MPEPEPNEVLLITYLRAEIGDVLQDADTQEIPEGWHLMDGSQLISYEWPQFVVRMGIKAGTFTLPAPQRVNAGHHWIIKLGTKRSLPVPLQPQEPHA